ncbi:MAG: FAD-dependent oxidoreductase [Jannaschia sp.]
MTDVVIVGGGLAGLALAGMLQRAGRSYTLLEGRDRFGGRILTAPPGIDLGPAWIWPGQPRVAARLSDLGLATFPQHDTGDSLHEDASGQVRRGRGPGGMAGSLRVDGGLGALTAGLVRGLRAENLVSGQRVTFLRRTGRGILVGTDGGHTVEARRVVLAVPPRLVPGLAFTPPLPQAALRALADVPTWMAGHAKAVAVYDRAFWRTAGLSGDALSRRGPLVELHDASGPDGGAPHAIFGFLGIPPGHRRDERHLRDAVLAQLQRLFGPEAAQPVALHLRDWAFDPLTATPRDHVPPASHPTYGPLPETLWEGDVILGGTEVAAGFGGFVEGALEAAEAAFARVT